MELSSIDTTSTRLAAPAFSCVPQLGSNPAIPAGTGIAGYAKQFMVGSDVAGHVQDATDRFWDRVGPPPG